MCKKAIAEIREKYGNVSANEPQRIAEAAELLLDKMNFSAEEKYPLPVVKLLNEMGFGLYLATFKKPEQSGIIAVDSSLPEKNSIFKGDRVVLVNREDSSAHQRFTIAHEIAHYIFDFDERVQPTYYKAYLTTEKTDDIELRANRFAAELLMPKKDFKKRFEQIKENQGAFFSMVDTITSLCEYFGVPATAVTKRIEETGCSEI